MFSLPLSASITTSTVTVPLKAPPDMVLPILFATEPVSENIPPEITPVFVTLPPKVPPDIVPKLFISPLKVPCSTVPLFSTLSLKRVTPLKESSDATLLPDIKATCAPTSPPFAYITPEPFRYMPSPSRSALHWLMLPPVMVNTPEAYTPPPSSAVRQPMILPPVMVNEPSARTPAPLNIEERHPTIFPPVIMKLPPLLTCTPLSRYTASPVITPPFMILSPLSSRRHRLL